MKKLFLVLAAAFAMVACQTDINEVGVVADGVATVEFEVGTPQMRAYSDGSKATQLQYAVYDANGNLLPELTVTNATINGSTTVRLELAKNKTYSVIFWAAAEGAPYEVTFAPALADAAVTVDYTNAACNDENRDAFYAYKEFEVKGAAAISVVLRRPFAQVNVGTSDVAEAAKSNFVPSTSTLVVKNACNVLNLVTGEGDGGVDATFTTATAVPSESFPVTGYDYLAMSYVLVGKDKGSYDVTYTINAADGTVINNTIGAVPMQANYRTNIYGKLLTSQTDINVEIKPGFDGNEGVETPSTVSPANTAELQAALDSAVNRSTIQLKAGVNYGVVYLRPYAGGTATKNVDWVGNNYGWETYTLFENLTIIGAEGATIDAVKIEGGTYYHTDHSQNATYPVMLSLVELKNVVFDGVTFIGNGNRYGADTHGNAVSLAGNNIKVDGLTFKNCVLKDDTNNNRLLYKSESTTHVHNYVYNDETFTFTPSLKNITITDCTFDGGYMGLELREAENVTITNNVFKVADRNILLPVNTGCTYSGAITITGNTSINAKERFVRASGIGDAVVVIKNNRILGYQGADADYIKVTGGNNVTIEDNEYIVSTAEELKAAAALTEALGKGLSVILDADIDFGSDQLAITGENQVVDLGGHALTTANNWGGISLKNGATIKNGTITHAGNTAAIKAFNGTSVENVTINATCTTADKTVTAIAVQAGANVESIKNVTINGVSQGIEVGYQATVGLIEKAVVNESNNGTAKGIGLVINGGKVGKAKDCTFKGETYGITLHLKGVFAAGLELENCKVEGTTASICAWDEKGISNTSGSLNLTYDAATVLTGPFVWDFEDECQSVVTLNKPQ